MNVIEKIAEYYDIEVERIRKYPNAFMNDIESFTENMFEVEE
tara:strand:- start:945 stop:1070 length:126 start_codon:yes stop_codon:yes gene_type:complete